MELTVTHESFNKAAKKLQKINPQFTLSKSQETLSQALGFRNYHGIVEYFNKVNVKGIKNTTEVKITQKSANFIENLSDEQLLLLLSSPLTSKGDMWQGRAKSLANAVISFLVYIRQEKEIVLSSPVVKDYFILENIIKAYKRPNLPDQVKYCLKSYLDSLPGYQEGAPKQNDTVREQHGYLQMQFSQIFITLEKLEKERVVLIPAHIVDKIIHKRLSYPDNTEFISKSSLVSQWESFESSNFFNEHIIKLIISQKSKISGDLYLDDLLVLSLNYIKEESRQKLFMIVEEFVQNLSVVKELSQSLRQISL